MARGEWAVTGEDAAPLWGHVPLGQRTQEIREQQPTKIHALDHSEHKSCIPSPA